MKVRSVLVAMLRRLRRLPWLWNILVRFGMAVGVTPENLRLLEVMSRPWWLYRSAGRVPVARIEKRSPQLVTAEDIVLCERLITAFLATPGKDGSVGQARGIWGWVFDTHQRRLADALERRNARDLANMLASMFQQEFVWGIAGGARIRQHKTRLGLRILSLTSLDVLVSLAEALGIVPVENPEQGRAGVAFDGGIARLVANIDDLLGFQIDFPSVGAPYGLMVDRRLITIDTPEQIYAALRLDQATRNYLPLRAKILTRVVEIGGGYGGMCYWFLRMRPDLAQYTIVDLPITNVLQGYFLAQALGASTVSFYGEKPSSVRIIPDSALADVDAPFEILVNKDSMPEMPHDTMAGYLEWGGANCNGLFYSYNQEARAEFLGEAQGIVSEAVERIGSFKRVRRDHSWLRRGYAEEIYLPTDTHQLTAATCFAKSVASSASGEWKLTPGLSSGS